MHVTESQGREYLSVINQNSNFSKKDWIAFSKNDLYGSPNRYCYNIGGGGEIVISPITIRYTKVLQDIFSLFNIREIKHIAEIGVGYGGQCRLIKEYLKNREYSLIDLPEAIELTKKFLDKFSLGEGSKTYFIDGTGDIENIEVDLLISNYAFSELNREVQNFYLEKIINYAGSGYITWNSLSYEKGDGYSVAELLEKKEHEGDAGVR